MYKIINLNRKQKIWVKYGYRFVSQSETVSHFFPDRKRFPKFKKRNHTNSKSGLEVESFVFSLNSWRQLLFSLTIKQFRVSI